MSDKQATYDAALPRAGSGLVMPCTLDEFMDRETEQRRGNGALPIQGIDKV